MQSIGNRLARLSRLERAVRVNSAAHAEVFDGVPASVVDAAAAALRAVFAATANPGSGGSAARSARAHSLS